MEQLQYSQSGSILQELSVFYLCFPYILNLHIFLTIWCIDVVDDVESLQDMHVYDKPDGDRLHQQPHSGKSQPHSGKSQPHSGKSQPHSGKSSVQAGAISGDQRYKMLI